MEKIMFVSISKKRVWHKVPAGKWLGTVTYFSDGYKRRVRNKDIWRLGYYAFGGFEDGPIWTYCYAYDEEAKPVALAMRYELDYEQKKFEEEWRND